jgi:hypothetical protein
VILGNSNTEYGKKLVAALQTFESPGFKPIHYNGYIPQAEYEKQLSLADVLWSPIQLHTLGIRKTAEVYGISTATGLTADLLLNEKPVLVPHGFQAPEHYEDALINYSSSKELIGLLNAFTLGIDEEISKKISQSFSFFRKENFETFFCKLMEIAT